VFHENKKLFIGDCNLKIRFEESLSEKLFIKQLEKVPQKIQLNYYYSK
jgi:hypothetical protein